VNDLIRVLNLFLSTRIVVILIALIAAAMLTFDLFTPLGVAGGVPYVVLVLLGMWLPSRRHILAIAGVGSVLTVIGFILSPPGGIPWVVLTNRGLALFTIWVVAYLLLGHKWKEEKLAALTGSLTHRTRQLEAANAELDAFCYSVSHDLRAPLRSMDGFSQALLEDYGETLDDQARDYLGRVRAGSQKMGQLIDDLLKLSRVTRGKLESQKIDLSALAQGIVANIRATAPERQASFNVASGLTAEGDARMLGIALQNLFENAWKFTAKHDHATIEFGVTSSDGQPAYFVRDDGAGFDMAYADKLFKPFQRLHSGAEFEGTGIGLATVERIVHRHGGTVWAESGVEQGTTVYFTLSTPGENHHE